MDDCIAWNSHSVRSYHKNMLNGALHRHGFWSPFWAPSSFEPLPPTHTSGPEPTVPLTAVGGTQGAHCHPPSAFPQEPKTRLAVLAYESVKLLSLSWPLPMVGNCSQKRVPRQSAHCFSTAEQVVTASTGTSRSSVAYPRLLFLSSDSNGATRYSVTVSRYLRSIRRGCRRVHRGRTAVRPREWPGARRR